MRIVVGGGTIIDPANKRQESLDLLIEDGLIREVGQPGSLTIREAERLDVSGWIIVPGLIDMHVHLREPGYEYKETVLTGAQAPRLTEFTNQPIFDQQIKALLPLIRRINNSSATYHDAHLLLSYSSFG